MSSISFFLFCDNPSIQARLPVIPKSCSYAGIENKPLGTYSCLNYVWIIVSVNLICAGSAHLPT
jgi:hypothetical protein